MEKKADYNLCDKGLHDYVKIYEDEKLYDQTNVVRWCQQCGAVVVDVICDNRTIPGRIKKLALPNIAKDRISKFSK